MYHTTRHIRWFSVNQQWQTWTAIVIWPILTVEGENRKRGLWALSNERNLIWSSDQRFGSQSFVVEGRMRSNHASAISFRDVRDGRAVDRGSDIQARKWVDHRNVIPNSFLYHNHALMMQRFKEMEQDFPRNCVSSRCWRFSWLALPDKKWSSERGIPMFQSIY